VVEGWYWALRSDGLKKGRAKPLKFLGRDLVVYRSASGNVHAMDAYCPHMGAHLAGGKVEADSLRCLFHYWKFDSSGNCTDIPCQASVAGIPRITTWPVREKYGLIWIWNGSEPACDIPCPPELEGLETQSVLGRPFAKECHPNVMMINAIDAQHFNSVHRMPIPLNLEEKERSETQIVFDNTTTMPRTNWVTRLMARFYAQDITYDLSYWFGSTGSVTLGPDFLHFYIIFALRPTVEGKSEGQTILVTRARGKKLGSLFNRGLLFLTKVVGDYFARGDTLIFKSIKFNLRTPLKADTAIIRFIQHLERQPTRAWGEWTPSQEAGPKPLMVRSTGIEGAPPA
jgi:phenylpropionate dioxygenase-like ring-hydroxylating dioxygenase large terminal subunit